jgi:NAD(P)-dependent dehydrogenase (short-subunit alcohol dehydrogenase family)
VRLRRRSKRANVLSALALAKRLRGSGVTALSLCPGNVRTNLGQNNFASWVVYEVFWFLHKSCSQGAASSVHACLNPALKAQPGAYVIHDRARTTAGCSGDAAEVLWRESCAAVGLTPAEEAAVAKAA